MKRFFLLYTIVALSACKKERKPERTWSAVNKDAYAVIVEKYDDVCYSSQGSPVVLEVVNYGYPLGGNVTAVNLPDSFKVKGGVIRFDMFPIREDEEYYKIKCIDYTKLPKVVYVYNVRWMK